MTPPSSSIFGSLRWDTFYDPATLTTNVSLTDIRQALEDCHSIHCRRMSYIFAVRTIDYANVSSLSLDQGIKCV